MKNKIGLSISIDYEIREKGKLIKSKYNIPGHSFVKQFIQWLFVSSFYKGITMTNTSGTPISQEAAYVYDTQFLTSSSSWGVQIGSGTDAVSINDNKLQTQIAHGTGTGQLQYSTGTTAAASTDATTTTWRLSRVFTNGSSGTVTVNEVGLVSQVYNTWDVINYYLFCRDIVSPIEVTVGQQLTLNYNLKTTI